MILIELAAAKEYAPMSIWKVSLVIKEQENPRLLILDPPVTSLTQAESRIEKILGTFIVMAP